MFTKVTTIINNKNYAIMKNLILVWMNNKPCRVFDTKEKAHDWILHMCEDYNCKNEDFKLSDILYYK